ncbi:hypothetical protein D6777_01975 [Candidatus Woesearchaeota archaeon]|nr:MAG: hypothetical protein D6777_01975 [Candidatus Woesearchaeota archaeon]
MEGTSKMRTNLKLLSLLVLLLVAVVPSAMAAPTFVFDKVEVNGDAVDLSNPETVAVERGTTLDLRVQLHVENASDDVDDLRLRAWIGGYEYDLLEDMTSVFKLSASESRKTKTLSIELPEDLEGDDYTLHVEVLNHNVKLEVPLSVEVERTRHKLSVQDVLVSPSNAEAGKPVFVTVRLENLGDKVEEDVKVEVSMLGVSAATYVDELNNKEDNENNYNDEEQTSRSTKALMLRLPEDVETGDYDLNVKVTYNRGYSVLEETRTVHVDGKEEQAPEETSALKAVVSVDTTAQTVEQGEETVYKLNFVNLGKETQLFSANVVGSQLWADARLEPSFVSVPPGMTGEMKVYLKAHSDAEAGNHLFTLQLLAGENLVKELPLGARVVEKEQPTPAAGAAVADGLLSASTLKLGFVGLVVLLVIVGLVVALRKLKDDDEYPLEPKDGQTYY